MKLKLSRVSKISSRFSRFSKVLTAFVYFSYFSSYFATTENQVLHAYKDWTGLISTDSIISSADVLSSEDISSETVSKDINEDIADRDDLAVSNDIPASSDIYDDNEFDNFVSHDTNDTGNTADTEGEAEDSDEDSANMADSGNTVAPVAPVPSGPDEENNDNTPNNENNPNNPNNPNDSESIAVLTTRLTSDHHLIATLSISGIMGADVAVFPNATGPSTTAPNTGSDEFTSAGGNIYTVSNVPNTLDTGGSFTSAVSSAGSSSTASSDNVDKPDSLLLNFENEEGVVESVRLWLDNEIDETVILDGISIPSDDTINTNSNGNDSGSGSNDSNFSSRAADGSNGSNVSQANQANQSRLAVPLSDLAAISDTKNIPAASTDTATAPSVLGYTLESFIGLDQLASPIIVILPSTNKILPRK